MGPPYEKMVVPIWVAILMFASMAAAARSKTSECSHEIVESIPDGLRLPNPNANFRTRPTHESLLEMIEGAKSTLRIASFYWELTPEPEFDGRPAVIPGRMIMDAVERAAARGVKVQVVLDNSSSKSMNNPDDMRTLAKIGQVKLLNMTSLLGAGVLHSKFLIADNRTFYIGSSNFDWRSYTEIKEIGIGFTNCQVLAQDLDRIFQTYIIMADSPGGHLPASLPENLKTQINLKTPLYLNSSTGGAPIKVFLGGAPPAFNGHNDCNGRSDDIEGLLHLLDGARSFVDISVMNYSPRFEFGFPKKYWPRIDDALRRAAVERGVTVRLLFSDWIHSSPLEIIWYKSLNALQSKHMRHGSIYVKLFKVPAFDDYQKSIPLARVKHDKYMVTDAGLYIGTSNWTPDYFVTTCGVGVVIQDSSSSDNESRAPIIRGMQDLFDRDFNSEFAHEL